MTSFHFTVVKGGKPKFPALSEQVAIYAKRLRAKDPLDSVVKLREEERLTETHVAAFLSKQSLVIALDERGQTFSSQAFAEYLQKNAASKKFVFLIGGPFGIEKQLLAKADLKLRISDFVMTSDLAWLVLWEQIYRAHKLISGAGNYHHG